MQELEGTWARILSVWWLMLWRSVVGSVLIGFAAGAVLGLIGALANWPADTVDVAAYVLGLVIGVLWGVVVLCMALKKRYEGFRIALVPV
jgi:ABC-type enterobactin transport system permease subunit